MSEEDSEDGDWFEQALSDARQEAASSEDIDSETPDDDWFEEDEPAGDDQTSDSLFEEESMAETGADDQDEDSLFEEDFASALASAGPDGETADAEAEEFDDEDFDTEIPRIDLGIEGLDEMIQGGIPERSLMVVMGSAGTGKTTFGLQFLNQGLNEGENAVYITLEETNEAIRQAAVEMGWPFDEYIEEGRLAVVDLDPIEIANSLTSIRSDLPRLIEAFGADRLVLDSVSLLEMMYNEPAKRRTEVFNFTKSLKQAGVTTMVTSEASDTDAYTSKHGIIEYLTDAVFVLQYVRSEFQETRMAVEIQKIRNANHSRETKPYEITGDGISVYRQANIF